MAGLLDRALYRLSGGLPLRVIFADDHQPYLERYFLFRACGWQVYLHRFVASDPDRGLHDHPWDLALSLVLSGGYIEERLAGFGTGGILKTSRRVRPGRVNVITGRTFHRVVLAEGTTAWSLFAHGAHRKEWGFLRCAVNMGEGLFRFWPARQQTAGRPWWRDAMPARRHALRCHRDGTPSDAWERPAREVGT